MSRPTECTPERVKAITDAVSGGNTLTVAAGYAEITYRTLCNWQKRGRVETNRRAQGRPAKAEEQVYFTFFHALKKAKADAEVRNVAIIQQAAKKQWQAAAWWLERRHPDRWRQVQRQEQTGKDGGPIAHTVTVTPAQVRAARMETEAWERERFGDPAPNP